MVEFTPMIRSGSSFALAQFTLMTPNAVIAKPSVQGLKPDARQTFGCPTSRRLEVVVGHFLAGESFALATNAEKAYSHVIAGWDLTGQRLRAQDSRLKTGRAPNSHLFGALTRLSASAGTSFARFRPELPFCNSERGAFRCRSFKIAALSWPACGGRRCRAVQHSPIQCRGRAAPETTTVRLGQWVGGAYCWASVYLAGELLRADGITDVRYVQGDTKRRQFAVARRAAMTDFDMNMPSMHITSIEAGVPIKVLTGVHTGCFELIANDSVQQHYGSAGQAGRGLGPGLAPAHADEPHGQLCRARSRPRYPMGRVTPDPTQDLHRRQDRCVPRRYRPNRRCCAPEKIGHTIVNNEVDRPWSQYFCCMVAGSADYVNKYPVATKRVAARHPQGRRLLRFEPGIGGAAAGRSRLSAQLRLRPGDAESDRGTTSGGTTIPRIRCASMRCACRRRA